MELTIRRMSLEDAESVFAYSSDYERNLEPDYELKYVLDAPGLQEPAKEREK